MFKNVWLNIFFLLSYTISPKFLYFWEVIVFLVSYNISAKFCYAIVFLPSIMFPLRYCSSAKLLHFSNVPLLLQSFYNFCNFSAFSASFSWQLQLYSIHTAFSQEMQIFLVILQVAPVFSSINYFHNFQPIFTVQILNYSAIFTNSCNDFWYFLLLYFLKY